MFSILKKHTEQEKVLVACSCLIGPAAVWLSSQPYELWSWPEFAAAMLQEFTPDHQESLQILSHMRQQPFEDITAYHEHFSDHLALFDPAAIPVPQGWCVKLFVNGLADPMVRLKAKSQRAGSLQDAISDAQYFAHMQRSGASIQARTPFEPNDYQRQQHRPHGPAKFRLVPDHATQHHAKTSRCAYRPQQPPSIRYPASIRQNVSKVKACFAALDYCGDDRVLESLFKDIAEMEAQTACSYMFDSGDCPAKHDKALDSHIPVCGWSKHDHQSAYEAPLFTQYPEYEFENQEDSDGQQPEDNEDTVYCADHYDDLHKPVPYSKTPHDSLCTAYQPHDLYGPYCNENPPSGDSAWVGLHHNVDAGRDLHSRDDYHSDVDQLPCSESSISDAVQVVPQWDSVNHSDACEDEPALKACTYHAWHSTPCPSPKACDDDLSIAQGPKHAVVQACVAKGAENMCPFADVRIILDKSWADESDCCFEGCHHEIFNRHEDHPQSMHTPSPGEQEVNQIVEHGLLLPPSAAPDGTGTELVLGKAEAEYPDYGIIHNQIWKAVNQDAEQPTPFHAVLQEEPTAHDASRTVIHPVEASSDTGDPSRLMPTSRIDEDAISSVNPPYSVACFHGIDIIGSQDRPLNGNLGKNVQVSSEVAFKVCSPFSQALDRLAVSLIAVVNDVHLLNVMPVIQVLRAVSMMKNLAWQALLSFQLIFATCLFINWDPGGQSEACAGSVYMQVSLMLA